jgi:flagellin
LINDLLPSFNPTDHPWLWSTTGAAAPANLLTHAHAQAALQLLDSGMDWLSGARASMGASVNRLTYSQDLIGNARLTASSSRSRIQDLDYGKATAELARAQIMQEAAAAVLAQANMGMQGVLELLA